MKSKAVVYKDGDSVLEGFTAYDSDAKGKLPTVLIIHTRDGRTEFEDEKAKEVAKLGFFAFTVDLFGQYVNTLNAELVPVMVQNFKNDRKFLMRRLMAAVHTVANFTQADSNRILVIGYGFGAMAALDAARDLLPNLLAVVTLHGWYDTTDDLATTGDIRAKILILHGAEDPTVPPEKLAQLQNELTDRKADWQLHMFGSTYNGFALPSAKDLVRKVIYSPIADQRSWRLMRSFFDECLLK